MYYVPKNSDKDPSDFKRPEIKIFMITTIYRGLCFLIRNMNQGVSIF